MGIVGNTYHLSTWEAEAGEQQVQGHPHIHRVQDKNRQGS